jgi:hypothetical protein
MYKIVGSDGKVYGPVNADKIREWIVQGRAESRTPILTEGAAEWRTIGQLAEFADERATIPPLAALPKNPALPARGTNGFAITGFACGLASWLLCCCCWGIPFNLLGLIFSIIALVQINGQVQKQDGWGLALAGLILSASSLLLGFGFGLMQLMMEPTRVNFHWGSI